MYTAEQAAEGSSKRVLQRKESEHALQIPAGVKRQLARRGSRISIKGLDIEATQRRRKQGKLHVKLINSPAIAKGFGGAVAVSMRSKSPKDYRARQRRKDVLPKEVSPRGREEILKKEELRRKGSIHLASQPSWWRGQGKKQASPSGSAGSSRSSSPRISRSDKTTRSPGGYASGIASSPMSGSVLGVPRKSSVVSLGMEEEGFGVPITEEEFEDEPADAADAVRMALVQLATVGRAER